MVAPIFCVSNEGQVQALGTFVPVLPSHRPYPVFVSNSVHDEDHGHYGDHGASPGEGGQIANNLSSFPDKPWSFIHDAALLSSKNCHSLVTTKN